MIALAYFSPPTRQQIDAADSAHRESAAGFLSSVGGLLRRPIAPARTPTAVERHGADGQCPLPSAPTIEVRP